MIARDRPFPIPEFRLGSLHDSAQARWHILAAARAAYQIAHDKHSVDRKKWAALLESPHWIKRLFGIVAVFEGTLEDPSRREELAKKIDELLVIDLPHVRIAANRAKEVLEITEIVERSLSDALKYGPGIEHLSHFAGAGFPVSHIAQVAEQLIRYPELRSVPPINP